MELGKGEIHVFLTMEKNEFILSKFDCKSINVLNVIQYLMYLLLVLYTE